jgi:Uma2 family endonuclease
MVRHGEIQTEQLEDEPDQPFGLAQCQAEHSPQRQGRGDRQGGEGGLPTPGRPRRRSPRRDRLLGKPDRQAAARLLLGLDRRLRPPCEAFGENVKVLPAGRVRYPDVKVACGAFDPNADHVDPVVVFEVLSPTTEMTDRRVKPNEYASIPSVMAYVLLAQDRPWVTVLRRASGWDPEELGGAGATLELPEVGVAIPLSELYPDDAAS